MTLDQFFAVKGSRFNNADAQIIGPVLQANEGRTTAELWEDVQTRPEDDPIRDYFVWDKNVAFDLYNIGRAMEMQRGVVIRRVSIEGNVIEARGFHMVPVNLIDSQDERTDGRGRPVRVIVSTPEAMQRPALAGSILGEVQGALLALRRKYASYQELIGARRWRALDDAIEAFDSAAD